MSVSKPRDESFAEKLIKEYARLLRERPVITKSLTSACTGALGSLISQMLMTSQKAGLKINWRSVSAYAAAGFVFIGPSVHHFHYWLERTFPKHVPYAALRKLLIDRFFFSPTFLLTYLYLLALFEGHSPQTALLKIKDAYWPALKMNWKVWTPLQFINVKYIPHQYRLPFMSFLALLWTVYIASKR